MCIVYVCIAYGHIYYISAMVTYTFQLNGCIHISCSTGLKWRHCSSLVCSHGEGLPMSTDDFFPHYRNMCFTDGELTEHAHQLLCNPVFDFSPFAEKNAAT